MPTYMISDPSQWQCAGTPGAQLPDHRCRTDFVIQASGVCPAMCSALSGYMVAGSTPNADPTAHAGVPVEGYLDCASPTQSSKCVTQIQACSDFAGTQAPWLDKTATPDAPYQIPSFLNEVSACT
jgi:hypothetical protein